MLLPHDWLTSQLTGRFTTDRGDASGTGYWSPGEGEYRWDLLRIVDVDRDWYSAVPEVLGPLDDAGVWRAAVVAPGYRRQHGRGARPRRRSGRRRGLARHVRHRVRRERTADRGPDRRRRRVRRRHGRFLPLVCTLNATKVTEAVRRLLGVDHEGLDALALQEAPGRRGAHPAAVPGRRAHAEPAGRHRRPVRSALGRDPLPAGAGGVRGGGVRAAGRLDALARPGADRPGASCSPAAVPARPPTARSSPTWRAATSTSRRWRRRWRRAPASRPRPCSSSGSRPRSRRGWGLRGARSWSPGPARPRRRGPGGLRGPPGPRGLRPGGDARDRSRSPCSASPGGPTPEAVRHARRRLAKELHPDHGGDSARMQAINVGVEEAMALILAAPAVAPAGAAPRPAPPRAAEPARRSEHRAAPGGAGRALLRDRGAPGRGLRGAAGRGHLDG